MKKFLAFILVFMCLFTTISSAGEEMGRKKAAQAIGRDGVIYTINEALSTISDGQNEYKFTLNGNGKDIEITYPDGSAYWEQSHGNGAYSGGWSDDYIAFTKDNKKNYTPGDVLCDVYRSKNPVRERKNILPCLIVFPLGLFSLLLPESAWYLHYGWKFKNAEPSDAAIIGERILGGLILTGLLLFFIENQAVHFIGIAGCIIGAVIMIYAQFKYNKGIF